MKFHLKNIRIRSKILAVFQFMALPMVIIFIILIVMMNRLNDIQGRILLENVTSITAAYNLENALLSLKGLKANYFLDGKRKWLDEFDANVALFNEWYNKAFDSAHTEEEQNILSNLSLEFAQYLKYHDEIIALVKERNNRAAIRLLLNDSMEYYNLIFSKCEALIEKNERLIDDAEKKLEGYLAKSRNLGYLIIVFFAASGIMLAVAITKSIVDPIKEIEKAGGSFLPANGRRGETERLREGFDKMLNEIKNNQQKLVQSERKAAIGEVAAGISHELNNPVGIILGFAEVLLKKKDLPEREIIRDIHAEARRCKNLLGEMLDFARSRDPLLTDIDIVSVLKDTINLFARQDKYKKITFHLDVSGRIKKMRADRAQIKQVVMNIMLNAFDALNNRGNVWVRARSNKDSIILEIEDDGPGVKEEIREKIFTPFFTNKAKGVGLGLAICRDLLNKHSGTIEYASGKKGAKFIIILSRGHAVG